MHIFASSTIALLLCLFASAEGNASSAATKPKLCDPNIKGPDLENLQKEAFADYVALWVTKRDVLTAYNRYVPGEYRQHSPFAQQDREFAIQVLSDAYAQDAMNITLQRIFSGQGFGMIHSKVDLKITKFTGTFSAVDYFRFRGTCVVEHWDILQQITGDETNPIAYF
ncbi:hypothetical protein FA13DRAFT_1697793 [Coprinellus micaceus]|uniref:SnoaL-like domain-containing protein n=1 Tax=Coprinellus micaceus TaxID=71717 RepID=A0A4Y7SCR2_COPMI|nr:hypothetical protein FA13DRAFT_1697793 [Coprinellus micaceus]